MKRTQRTPINKVGGVQEDMRGRWIGGRDDECYSVLNKDSRGKTHVGITSTVNNIFFLHLMSCIRTLKPHCVWISIHVKFRGKFQQKKWEKLFVILIIVP